MFVTSTHLLPNTPKKLNDPNIKDSFRDFEADTNDAWDDSEDDFLAMTGTKLSIKDVHLTAMQVMDAHSKQVNNLLTIYFLRERYISFSI